MNFKHLFPTFRNRYRFVKTQLQNVSATHPFAQGLNLGTGEGDYDSMIAAFCQDLIGCDVNEPDLQHAAQVNREIKNLRYEVNNALSLTYPSASFDVIVSCEVLEHVGDPARMMSEISRVLKPGGFAVMTFPSREFPFTYDPLNRLWLSFSRSGERLLPAGAYAFGHDYLIGSADFKSWCAHAGLEVITFRGLSFYGVGLLEMYWTGIVQKIFKKNAGNIPEDDRGKLKIRPATVRIPRLVLLTDLLLWVDKAFFNWTAHSVGKGVVLFKPENTQSHAQKI